MWPVTVQQPPVGWYERARILLSGISEICAIKTVTVVLCRRKVRFHSNLGCLSNKSLVLATALDRMGIGGNTLLFSSTGTEE